MTSPARYPFGMTYLRLNINRISLSFVGLLAFGICAFTIGASLASLSRFVFN